MVFLQFRLKNPESKFVENMLKFPVKRSVRFILEVIIDKRLHNSLTRAGTCKLKPIIANHLYLSH